MPNTRCTPNVNCELSHRSLRCKQQAPTMNPVTARCVGAAVGLLIDRLFGEPPAWMHPVALFGRAMEYAESALWDDRRSAGVVYALTGVSVGAAAGWLVRLAMRPLLVSPCRILKTKRMRRTHHPRPAPTRAVSTASRSIGLSYSTAAVVAAVAAGRELRRVACEINHAMNSGEFGSARAALPALVGRDTEGLDASEVSAAVIESVAENSVDAVIAPAFWGAVAGAPGAAAYRAINTMDAMVGHRSCRYNKFGWAAAKLDDVCNYLPARIFATLVATAAPRRACEVIKAVHNDAPAHPSPNSGVAEAAVAAALGVRVGGPLSYEGLTEDRPKLGSGPQPMPDDITSAVRLAYRVECAGIAVLVLAALATEIRAKRKQVLK